MNIEVINGGAIDVLLMDSSNFIKYQSNILGKSSEDSKSWEQGLNIKSKSYTFTFPNADRYYILIDNTIYGVAKPTGLVDVKVNITKEEALHTPGFEAIYSILLFTIVFCLLRKRLKS